MSAARAVSSHRTHLRAAAVVMLLGLACGAASGCAALPITATPGHNQPGAQSAPGAQPHVETASREDLTAERAIRWDFYDVPDSTHIRVYYDIDNDIDNETSETYETNGACHGQRVRLLEGSHAISINLFSGSVPQDDPTCAQTHTSASLIVELQRPIGARTVTQHQIIGNASGDYGA